MAEYALLTGAIVLLILGVLGCILPIIPGPPLAYGGLILLHITEFAQYSRRLLIILGVITVIVTILDYLVPIWGTRKFGGTKWGVRGATIGLIIGLFFGPIGIILGPFLGALVGELMNKSEFKFALKSALGSFLGFLLGVGLKLAVSFTILFYFIRGFFI